MFCKHCGGILDSDANFCPHCGQSPGYTAQAPRLITPEKITVRLSNWHTLMYVSFALWGISFILFFFTWFSFDYTIGFFENTTVDVAGWISILSVFADDSGKTLYSLNLLFFILIIVFFILTVRFFLKRHYSTFGSGKLLCLSFVLFTVSSISVIDLCYLSSDDIYLDTYADLAVDFTAAPVIIIVLNIAAFVIMLFAKKSYTEEMEIPKDYMNTPKKLFTVFSIISVLCVAVSYTSIYIPNFIVQIFFAALLILAIIMFFTSNKTSPIKSTFWVTLTMFGFMLWLRYYASFSNPNIINHSVHYYVFWCVGIILAIVSLSYLSRLEDKTVIQLNRLSSMCFACVIIYLLLSTWNWYLLLFKYGQFFTTLDEAISIIFDALILVSSLVFFFITVTSRKPCLGIIKTARILMWIAPFVPIFCAILSGGRVSVDMSPLSNCYTYIIYAIFFGIISRKTEELNQISEDILSINIMY